MFPTLLSPPISISPAVLCIFTLFAGKFPTNNAPQRASARVAADIPGAKALVSYGMLELGTLNSFKLGGDLGCP